MPPDTMLQLRPEQLAPQEFLDLGVMLFGEDGAAQAETDTSILQIAAAHSSTGWKPHKSGWNAKGDRTV
eukprot:CAMPEP_0181175516 /NCGR_PEP_ID=MMETSP1096-20121128/4122_1 /TAXON_ID=156174 ORGANISM="Chrysochromulina ericina, Strain CCMP281" /NCGR_SAMPLE_ID=MMETSP1096 /ASSEMBLY_ACC=CAM_ASM_000453 /LENGTH=68 /DNA_ID=CAMNT_0023263511 /DNA_START=133 /DNA_END=339 /DNA_ORIENTATION=-